MSLSTLNYPPLVAVATAGTAAAFPLLVGASKDLPFLTLKCANFVAYWINFGSVSQPGRLDGQSQSAIENGKSEDVERLSRQGRNLVSPSGWAFIIWAPIFMGELLSVSSQLFEKETGVMGPVIKSATAPFVAANIFQALWCASFRPKYKGAWMTVSFANLVSTAYSLSKVHTANLSLTGWRYLLYAFPTSLHFGWITAASLVNLNGAVAMPKSVSARTVAWVGHVSVVAAAALGVAVTWDRKAPVYGSVIAWALTAVADNLARRLEESKDEKDQASVGLLGAKLQHRLSQTGAMLSAGTSIAVTIMAILGSEKGSRGKVAP